MFCSVVQKFSEYFDENSKPSNNVCSHFLCSVVGLKTDLRVKDLLCSYIVKKNQIYSSILNHPDCIKLQQNDPNFVPGSLIESNLAMLERIFDLFKLKFTYEKLFIKFFLKHLTDNTEFTKILESLELYAYNNFEERRNKTLLNLDLNDISDYEILKIYELIKQKNFSEFMFLLHHYHPILYLKMNKRTVLHYIVKYFSPDQLFIILLTMNDYIDLLDDEGNSSLFYAVKYGKLLNLILLLMFGANPFITNSYGMSALHYAAIYDRPYESLILVSLGVSPGYNDKILGQTPLMMCVMKKSSCATFKSLIHSHSDINARDFYGNNIFYYIVKYDGAKYFEYMEDHHLTSINNINNAGNTALHYAASDNNYNLINLLMKKKSNCHITNYKGLKPADICDDSNCLLLLENSNTFARLQIPKFKIEDIASGCERFPIPLQNFIDNNLTNFFSYTKINIPPIGFQISMKQTCCACKGDCATNPYCSCIKNSHMEKLWYEDGKVIDINGLDKFDRPLIFECGDKCSCSMNCSNRLVQEGVQVQLDVIRTEKIGYSVRILQDVPEGTFICEYAGEICTNEEANNKKNDDYLMDLDSRETIEMYTIDSYIYGNVSRFINHSCDPNLICIRVLYDHHDFRIPHMCYFTNKNLKAGTSLSVNYGNSFWKQKKYFCLCESRNCNMLAIKNLKTT